MAVLGQEQALRFEKYGVERGLPNAQVLDILEDRFGFIWLATIDGLVKFDGYHFTEYNHTPGDNSTIASPIVLQLMEDRKGGIWIATQLGLSLYHRSTDNFELVLPPGHPDPPDNIVHAVFEDRDHVIWIGTIKGLFKFNVPDRSFLRVGNPGSLQGNLDIRCILQDTKGRIWAGGDHGLLKLDVRNNRLEFLDLKNPNALNAEGIVYDIEEDKNGALWLGTATGAKIWRPGENKIRSAPLPDSLAHQSVYDILMDRQQNLWLAFQHKGLACIDLKQYPQTRHFQRSPYLPNSLVNDQLYSLMLDKPGNLWIGTTMGCQKIDLSTVKFPVYQVKPGMEASENFIYRVHQGNKGGIWTTTINGKLFYAASLGEKPQQLFYSGAPHARNFIFYYSDSDNIVRAIHGKTGIYAFTESSKTWHSINLGDTINNRPNKVLFEDVLDAGILWIGNDLGLCKLNKRTNHRQWFYPSGDIPSASPLIYNMAQLPDGNIVANAGAFPTGTLVLFDQTTKKFKRLPFSDNNREQPEVIAVRSFALTKKHGIWMATPNGLVNFKNGKHRTLTSNDGLPTTSIMSVLSDEKDNIWIAYDGYLSKYMPAKDSLVSFDVRAEMEGFYSGSFSKGPDGQMFFGGNSGFMAFHPDSIKIDTTPPRVVLSSFKVLNRPRHFGTAPELIRNITLSHRDNIFSFQFAALNFIDSKNIRYKYKLEGFEETWTDAGIERTATYTNLDAGSYTFRAIACNRDGVWNEKGLTVKLTITPPWWATWWFRLFVAASIAGTIWFWVKNRLQQQQMLLENQKLQLEKEQSLRHERDRIAAEMHDELGAGLSTIRFLSLLAKEKEKDPANAERIDKIARSASGIMEKMADIIWVMNSRNDTLESFIHYVRRYAGDYTDTHGIGFFFEISAPLPYVTISSEQRRTLLMAIKEILHNVVKHSRATEVQLRFYLNGQLEIVIADNGQGIPPEVLKGLASNHKIVDGNGLYNIRQRMEALGGHAHWENNAGTKVTLCTGIALPR